MPSEWRPTWDRWVDERRLIVWILPLSSVVVVRQLLLAVWSLNAIWVEDFGDATTRKATILSMAGVYFAIMLYLGIGVSQLFLIELRRKFIAREVEWNGTGYRVRGYYFKRFDFSPADVASVEEYRVGHRYLSSPRRAEKRSAFRRMNR